MLNVNSSRPDRLSSASACWHQVRSPHSQSCELPITGTVVLYVSHLWNKLFNCYLLMSSQVQRYPTKYQIYLKSINGPIDVLLLNKRSVGAPPLVLPVPPPENILHNNRVDALDDIESDIPPCQASLYPNQSSMKDLWSSCLIKAEPNRTAASGCEYRTVTSKHIEFEFSFPCF